MFAKKRGYAVEPNQVCLASIGGCWVLGKTLFFTELLPPSPARESERVLVNCQGKLSKWGRYLPVMV